MTQSIYWRAFCYFHVPNWANCVIQLVWTELWTLNFLPMQWFLVYGCSEISSVLEFRLVDIYLRYWTTEGDYIEQDLKAILKEMARQLWEIFENRDLIKLKFDFMNKGVLELDVLEWYWKPEDVGTILRTWVIIWKIITCMKDSGNWKI